MQKKNKEDEQKFINDKRTTRPSIVAYFDILGYKHILESSLIQENLFIGLIEKITESVYNTKRIKLPKVGWKIYSFSDNYAIVINYSADSYIHALSFLIWILSMLQFQFFALYGVLIRGAIVKGDVYTGKNFIYGKGLVEAYEIENTIAVYPRVVVDSKLIDEIMSLVSEMLPDPIVFDGKAYNPTEINSENLFHLFPKMLLARTYNFDTVNDEYRQKVTEWFEGERDEDLVVICKDNDAIYYVDFLQYLYYLERYPDDDTESINKDIKSESIMDVYIQGFTFYLALYIQRFGKNPHLLKKYLWVCVKANEKLNCLGYSNLFNKSTILELCNLDIDKLDVQDPSLKALIEMIPQNSSLEE